MLANVSMTVIPQNRNNWNLFFHFSTDCDRLFEKCTSTEGGTAMAEGQGRSEGQGLKLLYLRDYFYKETGKEHQKDIDQIIAFLDSQNIRVSDKTLYSDFRQLREKLNVPIKYDGRSRKYYVTEPMYNGYELALLMDCICNAYFLTEGDAFRLLDIVKGLANVADRSMLAQRVKEYEKHRRIETSVIDNLRLLTEAIKQKRKVMFQKFRYVAEHTKHTELETCFIVASPLRIDRRSDGYVLDYWVEFCDLPEESERYFRAYLCDRYKNDRFNTSEIFRETCNLSLLTNLSILDKPAKELKPVVMEDDDERWMSCYEDWYGERAITIRFCKSKLATVVEELGADAVLIDVDNNYFKTTVKSIIDDYFFKWFSRFATYAKILGPQEAVDGYLEWCRRGLLSQEVLYRCDEENVQMALFDMSYKGTDREQRIMTGVISGEWIFDCQEVFRWSDVPRIEVYLPTDYDNRDKCSNDENSDFLDYAFGLLEKD